MPKPNNPYRRPIDATKESAMPVGAFYGTPATDKAINHAAGGRNIAPASRYQAMGHSNIPTTTTPSPDTTSPTPTKSKRGKKPEILPIRDHDPVIEDQSTVTAEDLFEW
jgi:hypothetical protein